MTRSELLDDLDTIADMVSIGGRDILKTLCLVDKLKLAAVGIFAERLEEKSDPETRDRVERVRTALNLYRTFGFVEFDGE